MDKPHIKIPNRPKPTYSKYAFLLPFEKCKVKFWKSTSPKYKIAVFICSLFPTHDLASEKNNFCNSLILNTEEEFYVYSDALYELFSLIYYWKYKELYIGENICYPDEFSLYMHTLRKYSFFNLKKLDVKAEIKIFKSRWTTEKDLYYIIRDLFVNETVINHYRAPWLENLELDIYIEDLHIGIEYQGIQHYKPLKHWGGEEGFTKRRLNDIRKKALCEKQNVTLIYFTYQEKITPEFVLERLLQYI